MNGWLNDVLAGYLENVSEREFDPAFLTYLRANQYADIHQIHGAFEFGKDFIAKRDGCQWVFQTKAGDLNLASWRAVRSQIEEMVWNDIAHPQFDPLAPRRAVLVTTGRLVGGASADAQQYASTLARRTIGLRRRLSDRLLRRPAAPPFEVWDRETLLAGLALTPGISLDGWAEESLRELLGLLADIDRRTTSVQSIERTTRFWIPEDPYRVCAAASVVADRVRRTERIDLACTTSFALIRSSAVAHHDNRSLEQASRSFDIARRLFAAYADEFASALEPVAESAEDLFNTSPDMFGPITYPVLCLEAVEKLGMLGLLGHCEEDEGRAAAASALLERFVEGQPGAAHPVSDRWAMSLVPAAALLKRHDSEALVPWLERTVAWICDHYERSPGLASVYATPAEEVTYLLGGPYEHVDLNPRTQSFVASVILDLACTLELPGLFADAYNDFTAVGLAFPVVEPLDERGQYLHDGTGVVAEANVGFDEGHDFAGGWMAGVHHQRAPHEYTLQRCGRGWELMAVSLLVRDRHFLSVTRQLANLG